METTQVIAPDIVCEGCANAIKKALGSVPGVARVDVDIPAKTVTVAHEPTVNREAIVATLDRAGFPAES